MSEGPLLGFEGDQIDLGGTGCEKSILWHRIETVHDLDSGNIRRYIKGYRIEITLRWSGSAGIPEANMPDLMELFNEPINGRIILCTPYSDFYPEASYNVIWDSDWDFTPVRGGVGVISQGSIRLVGAEVCPQALYFNQGRPRDP